MTAVITALAIAAPVGGARAATPRAVGPSSWLTEVIGLAATQGEFVYGGLAVGDVFNGGTTVVNSTGPAVGTTIDYPWW